MKFTYAYIEYKKEIFNKFLEPSLQNLDQSKNNLDIISEPNIKPTFFWNKIINKSKNKYIIFSHEDVTFPPDLLNQLEKTIIEAPNFGLLCVVGKNENNAYVGASRDEIKKIKFCDPCFFVINNENNYSFDEKVFDDFHFGAEDYCVGIKNALNKDTNTMLIDWGKEFKHYSNTSRTVQFRWGKYNEYKKIFKEKWKNDIFFKKF